MTVRGTNSQMSIIFWGILLAISLFLELSMEVSEELSIILFDLIGVIPLIGFIMAVLHRYSLKYRLNKVTLVVYEDAIFGSPKTWELQNLQSVTYEPVSLAKQILLHYPQHTIELQFERRIPRHGQVTLYTDDQALFNELKNIQKDETKANAAMAQRT